MSDIYQVSICSRDVPERNWNRLTYKPVSFGYPKNLQVRQVSESPTFMSGDSAVSACSPDLHKPEANHAEGSLVLMSYCPKSKHVWNLGEPCEYATCLQCGHIQTANYGLCVPELMCYCQKSSKHMWKLSEPSENATFVSGESPVCSKDIHEKKSNHAAGSSVCMCYCPKSQEVKKVSEPSDNTTFVTGESPVSTYLQGGYEQKENYVPYAPVVMCYCPANNLDEPVDNSTCITGESTASSFTQNVQEEKRNRVDNSPTILHSCPNCQHVSNLSEPADNATKHWIPSVNDSFNYNNNNRIPTVSDDISDLKNLWKEDRLYDVVMLTMGADVVAHKVALSTFSDDLSVKFSSLPHDEIVSINLSNISESSAQRGVNFTYTRELDLNDNNVIEILFCARKIGIKEVVSTCLAYIDRSITTSNAHIFFKEAKHYGMDDVTQAMTVYLSMNLTTMSAINLGQIPTDLLLQILRSDNIHIHSELDVFHTIIRWVNCNRTDRQFLLPNLLNCVRPEFINMEDLITRIGHDVVWLFQLSEARNWLHQVMWCNTHV